MTNTRVKVSKDKLIQKLKDTRTELENQYNTDLKAYEKNLEPLKKAILKALADYSKALEKDIASHMAEIGYYRGQGTVHIPFVAETVPTPQEPNFDNLDRMISALELSDEITITIGVNDQYYKYI